MTRICSEIQSGSDSEEESVSISASAMMILDLFHFTLKQIQRSISETQVKCLKGIVSVLRHCLTFVLSFRSSTM